MKSYFELSDYKSKLEQFCNRVERNFQPDCIILHGSLARGTHSPTSDIDLIVISHQLSHITKIPKFPLDVIAHMC